MLIQRIGSHEVQIATVGSFPEQVAAQFTTIAQDMFCKVFRRTIETLEIQGVLWIRFLLSTGDIQ